MQDKSRVINNYKHSPAFPARLRGSDFRIHHCCSMIVFHFSLPRRGGKKAMVPYPSPAWSPREHPDAPLQKLRVSLTVSLWHSVGRQISSCPNLSATCRCESRATCVASPRRDKDESLSIKCQVAAMVASLPPPPRLREGESSPPGHTEV